MGFKRIFNVAALALLVMPGLALADGDAPNFGNCTTTGQVGSFSLTTVKPETLTVATCLPNPGWWNGTSPKDTKDGFEYCLAAEIAHRAGLKHMKLMNVSWDQFIGGSASGYDLGMCTVGATEKRRAVFDFTQSTFPANLGVAVKAGAQVTEKNLRDKRIAVLQGNLGADWVIGTLKPSVKPSQFQDQAEMITALLANQVDAVMTDVTLLLTASAAAKGAVEVIGQYDTQWTVNIALPKGSVNTPVVDAAVGAMRADGTLDKLSVAYLAPLFGRDPNSIPYWQLP